MGIKMSSKKCVCKAVNCCLGSTCAAENACCKDGCKCGPNCDTCRYTTPEEQMDNWKANRFQNLCKDIVLEPQSTNKDANTIDTTNWVMVGAATIIIAASGLAVYTALKED